MSEVTNLRDSANGGRFLCFTLGKEKFAIPLLQVKEVLGNVETTAIPQAPPHFKGIMNLRGQVISVIDLRTKLKIGKPDITPETTIIIMDFAPLCLGVIVDSVDRVAMFESKELSEPPDTDSSMKADFITGVARTENCLTLILDLKSMLNTNDYKVIKANKAA
jgi:purine-binding chemotaxis protein CheW